MSKFIERMCIGVGFFVYLSVLWIAKQAQPDLMEVLFNLAATASMIWLLVVFKPSKRDSSVEEGRVR